MNNKNKLLKIIVAILFSIFSTKTKAQEGTRVIDNKGTLKNISKVFSSNATPTPVEDNVEGDIWFDSSIATNTIAKIWDNDISGTPGWRSLTNPKNWLLTGNSNTTSSNFLGTINDVRMQIRSNNTSILEFGRRATLGLVQSYVDYTDPNQYLVFLNGDNGVSALQFRADGANFYKPMFFTTPNGSFRLKGSSGRTDFFEFGSAGPNNDGRLEFIIGDDGTEPIVFKRYDYRSGRFYREFFRVQGSNNTVNAKTRFGININQNNYPVTGNINASSNGGTPAKVMANSTLQIKGSVSKSIIETTGNLVLTEDHHTIVLDGNHTITLPVASSCEGRIYIIRNPTNSPVTISSYIDLNGTNKTTIPKNSILKLQANSTNNWVKIGAYLKRPTIIASGQVERDGSCVCSGANVSYNSSNRYYYISGFVAPSGANRYIIQLTLEAPPVSDWATQIYYYDKNLLYPTNGDNFKVKIIDRLQGTGSGIFSSGSNKRVRGRFSFVVIGIP